MSSGKILLVGAGGHSKAIVEALGGGALAAYVDDSPVAWLEVARIADDETALQSALPENFVMGLGGESPAALDRRYALFEKYVGSGRAAPPLCHPTARVSPSAEIGAGAIILAGAIVQPGATIGRAAIVNTGAIIEHDSKLGTGSHLAPGAMLLGEVAVGRCSMVGANAVVLPQSEIGDRELVPANTLHRAKAKSQ